MKTPKSAIKGHLRRAFLRSRERAGCLKRDAYTCRKCGIKQSKKKGAEVKVEVDHVDGIDVWDELTDLIYKKLLCSDNPSGLQTLCVACHRDKTRKEQLSKTQHKSTQQHSV